MHWLTNFHLDEGGLIRKGPRKHTRVTEAGPQQHGYDEEEEHGSKHWDGRREVHSQEGASAREQQQAGVMKEEEVEFQRLGGGRQTPWFFTTCFACNLLKRDNLLQ